MNLIEAIKSGKKFKREAWSRFEKWDPYYPVILSDVLADDWEIEEKKVEITRTQFFSAIANARKNAFADSYGVSHPNSDPPNHMIWAYVAKELGLE